MLRAHVIRIDVFQVVQATETAEIRISRISVVAVAVAVVVERAWVVWVGNVSARLVVALRTNLLLLLRESSSPELILIIT